ncbi:hypothetical protein D3C76_1849700 [compost metagenome]
MEGDERLYGRLEALIRESLQTREHQTMMEKLLATIAVEMEKMVQEAEKGDSST